MVKIIQAEIEDIDLLAPLVDAYRQFYGQPSNLPAVRDFLFFRLLKEESVVFMALQGEKPVGFLQLYPSFSTVQLKSQWILNDLFVIPKARKQGIGKQLMAEAKTLAKKRNDCSIVLETAENNQPAKALYESLGYQKSDFDHYYLTV